jgi:hypothetical protein
MLSYASMTDDFAPHLDVLSKPQRRLWDELAAVPPEFVLYGGTAIALHLGHRQSVDFDFFGSRTFDPAKLTASVPFMTAAKITQREPNTLSGIVDRGGLSTALASAQALYGPQFNPEIALKALSFFDEGNLRRLSKATKDRLAQAVREVDLDRLPTIARPAQPRDTSNGPAQ